MGERVGVRAQGHHQYAIQMWHSTWVCHLRCPWRRDMGRGRNYAPIGAVARSSRRCRGLQEMRNEIRQAATFDVRALLKPLMELPVEGCCHPLRLAPEQLHAGIKG